MAKKVDLTKRQYVIGGIACGVILIYIIQLFNLQIVKSEYKDSADGNAFFNRVLYPARGIIYDRNGRMLVYNQPTYDLVYIPREVQPFDTLDLCRTLNITKDDFDKRILDIKNKRLNPGYSTYTLQTFMTQLTSQENGLLQEKLYKFPGFFLQKRTLRQYTYPNAGLLFGYVAEVNKSQMEKDEYYARGDYGGKSGIELSYEKHLRGEKGVEVLLRDAHGRIQGRYEDGKHDLEPIAGKNLTLSIDMELQAYGEYLMNNKVGSIVMIEPSTGEVLCMVSAPTYDPSLLLGRDFSKNYQDLEDDPYTPLFDRSTQGWYPPGSTFKTTQGLIFLEEGIITDKTMYSCARCYPPLGRPKCHGHASPLPLIPAIATSCNSYFCYGLAAMLNNREKYKDTPEAFEVWKNHIVKMGFGYTLGVDLPSEKRGFIPNSNTYNKWYKSNWNANTIISIAIGQGEVTTTPVQVANLAATIANRGHYYVPHVVRNIQDTIIDNTYLEKKETGIKQEHYEKIVNGMAMAVTNGTCHGANLLPDIEVCGKTGTAENAQGKDHSIFMGFAPKEKPEVAIFVIVEHGGFGARNAVPIGRLMLQKYLKGEVKASDKPLEKMIAGRNLLPPSYLAKKLAKQKN